MSDTLRDRVLDVVTMRVGDLAVPPHPLFSTPSEQWFDRADAVLQAYGKHKVLRAYRSEANAGALTLLDNDISLLTLAPDSQWRVAITDLTDAEAAVIRPAEYELWRELEIDIDALGAQLRQADTDQPDIMALLSDLAEHAGVVGQLDQPAGGGDEFDTTPALEGPTRSQPGQLWLIDGGRHRLLVGDCTDPRNVERLMGGERAALCLTDPPYGVNLEYKSFNDTVENVAAIAKDWLPLVRQHSDVTVFSPGITRQWLYPEPNWVICWFYGGGQLRSPWGFNCWQPFLCYGKDPSLASGNGARPDAVNMNTPANAADLDHPCPKPLALWQWLLERLCFAGNEIVLDPFLGSGTTLIAAHRTGRRCYGMEIEPRYADVILRRAEAEGLSVELEHTNE